MFSKFKVMSTPNTYSRHFPLVEVYEAEIRRLRSENEFLKLQHNSLVVQLKEAQTQISTNNKLQMPLLMPRQKDSYSYQSQRGTTRHKG